MKTLRELLSPGERIALQFLMEHEPYTFDPEDTRLLERDILNLQIIGLARQDRNEQWLLNWDRISQPK